ncbi:MAG: SDR family NAD(P)-dependent oxidoreductase, partial [Terriglobales bacterium]
SVVICGRRQESVERTVGELCAETESLRKKSGGKVEGKAADVRNNADVSELFQFADAQFGGLDVLVNNAGVGIFRPITELTVEDWQYTIETNLTGVFLCCREALTRFASRSGGYIINISSLAGKNPFAGGAAYNASKFALTGFSEAVMQDTRQQNVRVSYIMPGSVATDFNQSSVASESGRGSESGRDWKIWPEDIAEMVRMLLRMPPRTLISRLEVRPARPKR